MLSDQCLQAGRQRERLSHSTQPGACKDAAACPVRLPGPQHSILLRPRHRQALCDGSKGPTSHGSCLVVLFKEEVAWALREKWQACQLDQGRNNDHSKQVWPGALLRGEDSADGGGLWLIYWGTLD